LDSSDYEEVINADDAKDAKSELNGALWFISLLSRIDGLVLMDQHWHVRGFGVEITVKDEPDNISFLRLKS